MKKEYMTPTMQLVALQHKCHLLTLSSETHSVSTNFEDDEDNFQWGGGGNDAAR